MNSTKGTNAITTGKDVTTDKYGTWQVYVASPSDYGTSLGDNLNSKTNAQWSSESTKHSATDDPDKNAAGKDIGTYTDYTQNKFIFQVTPVITISGGYTSKTYGDTLSEKKMAETLTSKAIYRDSKGSDIDVTGFKNNFDESNYLDYVTNSDSTKKGIFTVNVSSEGAAQTATRTNGNEKVNGTETYKTADDKNRAFYVMNVAYQDGVKTLNGYDKAANPGEVEIKRKTLTINTDATQTYGNAAVTSRTTNDYSSQLVNKDKLDADDITYTIATDGSYAGSKGSNDTAHVGSYENQYLTTGATVKASDGSDASANYAVTGSGTITVNPRDVYFHVTGNGKTIDDVVYTVTDTNPNPDYPLNPNDPINSQLVYGETVTPSYTPDGRLPNGHYGVSTSLPGYGPIESGKVYGNYRYHYDGDVTLTTPSKPDIVPPVNPPVTPGTGTVTPLPETPENTSNTPENTTETTGHKTVWDGDRDRGGDRPEDKRVVTLPFFKVLEDKTTHRYGTYDVAKRTTEVKIAPSAQVLPEPNQPATQYRELTTELTTDKGMGEFTLKYNGSRFTILPDDDAAMKLIVVGDETKNRALFEKALHVAFTQMGLEVADLDGVYIHFGKD